MKNPEKRFLLILLFSVILHAGILIAFSVSSKPEVYENKVEINLNNIPEEQPPKVDDVVKPEQLTKVNPEKLTVPIRDIKPERVKPVHKLLRERRINYSELAKIESNIPMNYPVAKKVPVHPVVRHVAPKRPSSGNPKLLSLYLRKVRALIESHKMYPLSAREKGIEGKVLVSFVVLKDGSIKDLRILKSSGSRALDEAARKAIADSVPFPPFPPQIKRDRIRLKLYIVFKLEDEEEW